MNIQMKDGIARVGRIEAGNIEISTYQNGTFDIALVDDIGDGYIVATGQWKGYNKDLTKAVWDYFINLDKS